MGITNPAEAHFERGVWGFDGSVWRKLPLLWGYTDRIAGLVADTNADVGDNNIYSSAVPAGVVWVIQAIGGSNWTKDIARIEVGVMHPADHVMLHFDDPPAADRQVVWTGEIVIKEGDKVFATMRGCDAGDDLYLRYWGYEMAIG